jgi:hypothetical protein
MTNSKISNHLKYLKDVPLYEETITSKKFDYFYHTGYIESLHNLINECPTPFCIGLFGGWGTGKTGIVKGLIEKGESLKSKSKTRYLYFDVWKHSADSLRRQLLIEIDKKWHNGTYNFENKLYVNSVKRTDFSTSFSWKRFKWHLLWLIPVAITIVRLVYLREPTGWNWTSNEKEWINVIGAILLPTIIAILTSLQSKGETNTIIEDVNKPTSPEEFERLFTNSLNITSGVRNVFILDNLDRVENDKVFEVLTGINTFLDKNNCIYIIPCDEDRLKVHISKVLNIDNGKDKCTHQEDFLRKLFNVQVSLRPVIEGHLIEYINDLIKELGITTKKDIDDLNTILLVGLSNNPRRIKQFLNNFVTKYNVAYDIERQASEVSSLPEGIITKNIGFLAKAVFLKTYFSNVSNSIENNPGTYKEIVNLIKSKQLDDNFKVGEDLENILKNTADGLTLKRFLNATNNINDSNADIFFRFSGNTNIITVESIRDIIDAALGRNTVTIVESLEKHLDNLELLQSLENNLSERIKSNTLSDHLKVNIIYSLLHLNKSIDDERIKRLVGNTISKTSDKILRQTGEEIDPTIWTLAGSNYLSSAKIQSIGRIMYSKLTKVFTELKVIDGSIEKIDINKLWKRLGPHLQSVNNYLTIFDGDVKEKYSYLTEQIIIWEIRSTEKQNEDFWKWLLHKNIADIPSVIKQNNSLVKISKAMPSRTTQQIRNCGLLISKLSKYSKNSGFFPMLNSTVKTFKEPYDPENDSLFAPNIVQEWIINSNKIFDSTDVNTVYNSLIEFEDKWEADEYILNEIWYEGFVELYAKADEDKREELTKRITSQIQESPELYIQQFNKNMFNRYHTLNYEALINYVSQIDFEEDNDEKNQLNDILLRLLNKVYNSNCRSIYNTILTNLWRIKESYSYNLNTIIFDTISTNYEKYRNNILLIKQSLTAIINKDFWANTNDELRRNFIRPILNIIDMDRRISKTETDDLIEPLLKSIKNLTEDGFKTDLNSLRKELFNKISVNCKKRVLNQIWTSYTKLTGVAIDNPDLKFLMIRIGMCKEGDKREIVNELFEQLNSNTSEGLDMFIKYGISDLVVNENQSVLLGNVLRYLKQNDNEDSEKLKEHIRDKMDKFGKNRKSNELRSILFKDDKEN